MFFTISRAHKKNPHRKTHTSINESNIKVYKEDDFYSLAFAFISNKQSTKATKTQGFKTQEVIKETTNFQKTSIVTNYGRIKIILGQVYKNIYFLIT